MRLGIVGSGKIGGTVAGLAVAAGHEVALANARGPESLAGLVGELGPSARAASVEGAAAFAGLVLLAIPLNRCRELPAGAFAGRIVIDATNYFPAFTGVIDELEGAGTTSSELLASWLPGATVVKAFNTHYYEVLGARGGIERMALPLAGDDAAAKARVAELIESLGFSPLDAGGLAAGGRLLEPGGPLSGTAMSPAEAAAAIAA